MKNWNLSTGYPRKLSKASTMLLLYSGLTTADPIPSISFLEYLAQEDSDSWMKEVLDTDNTTETEWLAAEEVKTKKEESEEVYND